MDVLSSQVFAFLLTCPLDSSLRFVLFREPLGGSIPCSDAEMSKLAFTIMLPHDKTDGKRTPGFFISTSNMTYLNVKGRDWKSSRWGNGNASSGWKNRVEYGVTASKGVTKLSL